MGRGKAKRTVELLDASKQVLDRYDLRMTVRGVHYRLFVDSVIDNTISEYRRVQRVLRLGRYDGAVEWDDIEDQHRHFESHIDFQNHWDSPDDFIESELQQMENILWGYRRNSWASQKYAVEVWCEKNTLLSQISPIVEKCRAALVIARGYVSDTFLHNLRVRTLERAKEGRRTVILYLSDFDPSGMDMLPSTLPKLRDKMKLGEDILEVRRIGVTEEQIKQHNLPVRFDAVKRTDTRAMKFLAKYGDLVVELDAFDPYTLQQLVADEITPYIDQDEIDRLKEVEHRELAYINVVRQKLKALLDINSIREELGR